MFKKYRILALITARGGSKGLPKKNIKLLRGKPLIGWTIKEALKSRYLDEIAVSTDDKEIASISRKFKARVPFMRPKSLATDGSKSIDVILHAIKTLEKGGSLFDILVLLQPTSPLRIAADIDRAIMLLFGKRSNAVVSVTKTECPAPWINKISKSGNMRNFIKKEFLNKRRQDLEDYYKLNGAVYVARCKYLKKEKSFFGNRTTAYIMPRDRSIDIDTKEDFELAEYLLKKINKRGEI